MPGRIPTTGGGNQKAGKQEKKQTSRRARIPPVFSFSCLPDFLPSKFAPLSFTAPRHDGRHPWYVGVESTRFGQRWLNQRTTGAPTCRRLAPDFALFPYGYRVTGFPIGHPSPKNAKSAAAVRLSLSDDTLGDGFQEEAIAEHGFTDGTVREESRRDGRTTARPGARGKKRRAGFTLSPILESVSDPGGQAYHTGPVDQLLG